jgi:hypothetical protein
VIVCFSIVYLTIVLFTELCAITGPLKRRDDRIGDIQAGIGAVLGHGKETTDDDLELLEMLHHEEDLERANESLAWILMQKVTGTRNANTRAKMLRKHRKITMDRIRMEREIQMTVGPPQIMQPTSPMGSPHAATKIEASFQMPGSVNSVASAGLIGATPLMHSEAHSEGRNSAALPPLRESSVSLPPLQGGGAASSPRTEGSIAHLATPKMDEIQMNPGSPLPPISTTKMDASCGVTIA